MTDREQIEVGIRRAADCEKMSHPSATVWANPVAACYGVAVAMAYLTIAQAVNASRSVYTTRGAAESIIRKSGAKPATTWFDIFLSHSIVDARVIAGVVVLLEQDGKSVYVDWRDDALLDRSSVTAATAGRLRDRMQHCRFMLYATSRNATNSKWMPWELGYFDGLRSGSVGILPIVNQPNETFTGQEYLGLYPRYELLNFYAGAHIGKRTPTGGVETLTDSIRKSA